MELQASRMAFPVAGHLMCSLRWVCVSLRHMFFMIPNTSADHHSTPLTQEVPRRGWRIRNAATRGGGGDGQEKEEEDEDVGLQQARMSAARRSEWSPRSFFLHVWPRLRRSQTI